MHGKMFLFCSKILIMEEDSLVFLSSLTSYQISQVRTPMTSIVCVRNLLSSGLDDRFCYKKILTIEAQHFLHDCLKGNIRVFSIKIRKTLNSFAQYLSSPQNL